MAKVRIDPPQLTPQEIKRFWSYVDRSPGQGPKGICWRWAKGCLGQKSRKRYGTVQFQKRKYLAHRIAFFLAVRQWPSLLVCHSCDWPPCCNPAHLFTGTISENGVDMVTKNRCSYAKLTAAQVIEIRALYAKGGISQKDIAKRYGVTRSSIWPVVHRKNWRHI